MKNLVVMTLIVASLGCATKRPMVAGPAPSSEEEPATPPLGPTLSITRADSAWSQILLAVAPLAQSGSYATADSLLAHFEGDHDGTCPAAEARYLRALLLLSPGNAKAAPRQAIPLLDSFLASTCLPATRGAEIAVLRTMARDLEKVASNSDSSSAATIRKLQEQLDQTNKELARLKMRVIPPVS